MNPAVTDFEGLLRALTDEAVEFVVIGGVALVVQGAPRTTADLDICYARTPENLERLARALGPLAPTLRGAPPGLPFALDARSLRSGLNFTLDTNRGELDLLGEVPGVGGYSAVAATALPLELYGRPVLVMGLDGLEQAKRSAGRLKDLADLGYIAELKKLRP